MSRNALLDKLPGHELDALGPVLHPVKLRANERLIEKHQPIIHAVFLDEGWASVMSTGSMRPVEVAVVGAEGVVGACILLGVAADTNNCIMQTDGRGRRVAASVLIQLLPQTPVLRSRMLFYIHQALLQSYNAVVATTFGSLEARVARGILIHHDRSLGDEISITQDELARKVGANRAGVTAVLHLLEGQQIIRSKRRCVLVVDRQRLEKAAAGTYAPVAALGHLRSDQ
ncbi:putative Transcriptional regulator, Crp/Fnr family [Bradyrhizobium sp. ORS 375]|uniref:Crp/Fnr family transcriptional regulator n=1 Tax=Bradyrhizobium sp. (strain ORS 375) TaxID=566679 RepID=UPI0002405983|nr:Crp/Fnr family transcriptional regulator [Bradyrhizobium sp. ORS 375]CCD95825.1 putative Transcriptional regulator, Crp/Fnr family [Bradyrhizobium sp. ORS 375]